MGFEIENGVLKNYINENGVTEVVIPNSVKKSAIRHFPDAKIVRCVALAEFRCEALSKFILENGK